MGRVSQWAVRRPWFALGTWVGIMVLIGVLGTTFGGDYNDNFELPNTESTTAQDLLGELSGSAGTGAGLDGQIVWSADSGNVTDATSREHSGQRRIPRARSPKIPRHISEKAHSTMNAARKFASGMERSKNRKQAVNRKTARRSPYEIAKTP